MAQLRIIFFASLVINFSIDGVVPNPAPIFDIGRRYPKHNVENIATTCRRICKASHGIVQIEGDTCRCKIRTDDPDATVNHVLRRVSKEGLNVVHKAYPRFKRSPCVGVLSMAKNPTLMQQRLRAYGVGMLAPILGISPEQVNSLVSDFVSGNADQQITIGQSRDTANIGNVAQNLPAEEKIPSIDSVGEVANELQNFVSTVIEAVPAKNKASDLAVEGEPVLASQNNIGIVGGVPVPSMSIVGGTEAVDGPIVSPFKNLVTQIEV